MYCSAHRVSSVNNPTLGLWEEVIVKLGNMVNLCFKKVLMFPDYSVSVNVLMLTALMKNIFTFEKFCSVSHSATFLEATLLLKT